MAKLFVPFHKDKVFCSHPPPTNVWSCHYSWPEKNSITMFMASPPLLECENTSCSPFGPQTFLHSPYFTLIHKVQSSHTNVFQKIYAHLYRHSNIQLTRLARLLFSIMSCYKSNFYGRRHFSNNKWCLKMTFYFNSPYNGCPNMIEFLPFSDCFYQISDSKYHTLSCYLRSISHAAESMVYLISW